MKYSVGFLCEDTFYRLKCYIWGLKGTETCDHERVSGGVYQRGVGVCGEKERERKRERKRERERTRKENV